MRIILVLVLSFITAGCVSSNVKPEVVNAMAYCNSGISSELSSLIKASVEKNGGEFTAKVGDEIKGEFLSRVDVSEANAVALHKQYIDCMDRYTRGAAGKEKQAKIDDCVTRLQCELDQLDSACRCSTTIEEVSLELGVSKAISSRKIASDCYSGRYSMSKCWKGDMVSERSACETMLRISNLNIPTPSPKSCLVMRKEL